MRTATEAWARRATGGLAALACAGALTSCTVPRPPGDGTLRYRDMVFTTTTVARNLQYGSAPDAQGNPVALRLDLYQPAGDTRAGRPAVVWIHGGGFRGGTKANAKMVRLAREFAQRGYVTVSIDYRLLATEVCGGTETPPPSCQPAALAAQHDAQAAVRWLRRNAATYRIDPTRIAVGGGSAGAVAALLVGANAGDVGDSGNPGFSSAVRGAIPISGALPGAYGDAVLGAGDAPTLFFVGTADTITSVNRVLANAGRLYNAGVLTVAEVLEGAGHVPVDDRFGELISTQSAYFLYWTLDLAHAQGQPPSAAREADATARRLRAR
jgi:acetyl esterase/lipase